jgi:hypothetical protein
MATVGQRGKWAETQVRNWMKIRSDADARFAFMRYPDARAGSLQAAPSDFEASSHGTHYKVEVKEVKITTASTRRLPSTNFSADKVARMMKWRMAGDEAWVIVVHLAAPAARAHQEWRLIPIEHFKPGQPSWDVSMYKAHARLADLMLELFPEKK